MLLDCRSVFDGMGGIGRATAELARNLPDALASGEELLLLVGARPPRAPLGPAEVIPTQAGMIDSAFEQVQLPGLIEQLEVDVYHGTCFATPLVADRAARVATVHDVVFRRHPELVEPGLRAYLDRWTRVSCELAEAVVTVSEFSRQEIAVLYGRPLDEIEVVPNAVDERFKQVSRRPPPGLPYLLYVGSMEAKKNVSALLSAFATLLRREPGLPHVLVLVGGGGGAPFDLAAAIAAEPGLAPRVHPLGRVPDEAVLSLLGSADLFVYPSEYEGFGLPPLEAMAAGVPTIVSNRASLPEVVGDGAVVVDPHDREGFASAMARLLTSAGAREALVRRGRRRASSFSWRSAAERLAGVYRQARARGPRQAPVPEAPALRVLAGGRA
ncbi:MAG: glycosyltransferase family 4 protein [Planctomycetes bacterium]|nr:glycosyltransferase family 4 protein [Planctomycetota bacterium]